eukprot:gnl/MRDRNA2_/MRDRNA2_76228_c0_seq1.p1 gnl/MRDRNA2_/MRDRNA2_76228_c0~~gnl/MRDRNA2_/MRDRNA2_76228_c0_seq1.p1  ORF type:complete len:754 (+),score=188.20 gnl/MRDRNA2_/MRDRNA2_76228_c0_seq1:98-2359(+)
MALRSIGRANSSTHAYEARITAKHVRRLQDDKEDMQRDITSLKERLREEESAAQAALSGHASEAEAAAEAKKHRQVLFFAEERTSELLERHNLEVQLHKEELEQVKQEKGAVSLKEHERVKEEHRNLNDEYRSVQDQHRVLQDDHKQFQQEFQILQRKHTRTEEELGAKQRELDATLEASITASKYPARFEKELETIRAEKEEKEVVMRRLLGELSTCRTKVEGQDEEIQRLKNELQCAMDAANQGRDAVASIANARSAEETATQIADQNGRELLAEKAACLKATVMLQQKVNEADYLRSELAQAKEQGRSQDLPEVTRLRGELRAEQASNQRAAAETEERLKKQADLIAKYEALIAKYEREASSNKREVSSPYHQVMKEMQPESPAMIINCGPEAESPSLSNGMTEPEVEIHSREGGAMQEETLQDQALSRERQRAENLLQDVLKACRAWTLQAGSLGDLQDVNQRLQQLISVGLHHASNPKVVQEVPPLGLHAQPFTSGDPAITEARVLDAQEGIASLAQTDDLAMATQVSTECNTLSNTVAGTDIIAAPTSSNRVPAEFLTSYQSRVMKSGTISPVSQPVSRMQSARSTAASAGVGMGRLGLPRNQVLRMPQSGALSGYRPGAITPPPGADLGRPSSLQSLNSFSSQPVMPRSKSLRSIDPRYISPPARQGTPVRSSPGLSQSLSFPTQLPQQTHGLQAVGAPLSGVQPDTHSDNHHVEDNTPWHKDVHHHVHHHVKREVDKQISDCRSQ